MSLRKIFRLNTQTVGKAQRQYNLVVGAAFYGATVVALALLGFVVWYVLGWIGKLMGLPSGVVIILESVGAVAYVCLVIVSCSTAVGDSAELALLYMKGWGRNHDADRDERDSTRE